MLYDLQRQPGFDPQRLSSLRVVLGGGAAVPESTVHDIEATFAVEFLVAYGQSESVGITQTHPGDPPDVKARTIGRPNPGRVVKIADLETSKPVPVGTVGEICQRSTQQMTHYLGMPEGRRSRSMPTAGCTPATSGPWTTPATSLSVAALRDRPWRRGHYPDQVEAAYADAPGLAVIAVVPSGRAVG